MTQNSAVDHPIVRIAGRDPDAGLREGLDHPVRSVGPTGVPDLEPLVMVTRESGTAVFTGVTEERLAGIRTAIAEDEDAHAGDPDVVAEHDEPPAGLPTLALPGFPGDDRRALAACGWRRPTDPDDHEAAGGFVSIEDTTLLALGSDLRGRGWGDACRDEFVFDSWETVRSDDREAVVVVNGHGAEPDELLLRSAPFEVLEGAQALARSIGAERIVVYASEERGGTLSTVEAAIDAYPGAEAPMEVVPGPAVHRAAEPTMAIEAIEGNDRLEARLRPPGPAEFGVHGQPTVVHTPRTFAQLAVGMRDGELPETRILTVSGDVTNATTLECPQDATLETAVEAVDVEGSFKAASVGGAFGGITRSLDIDVDPSTLGDADLGTDGTVHVLSEDRCMLAFVGERAQFAADENCGRCVPCREGTTQLLGLLRDIYEGDFDPEGITELTKVMETSSICDFGVDATRPVRTALDGFAGEIAAHADGQCPAGDCHPTIEGSP